MDDEPRLRFAAIGECMVELRHRADGALDLGFGGDTLNTAIYLRRVTRDAGVRVDYVTALGQDPYSDAMMAAWQAEGIATEHVARLAGRLPGLYMIRTDPGGERTFYYWRSEAAARDMLAGDRPATLAAALAGYDMLNASGITLSVLDPAQRTALAGLLAGARGRGAVIAFDGNFRPRGWSDAADARTAFEALLRHCSIALPTFDDEQALFGDPSPEATADRLHGWGVAEVVVKLGPAGVLLSAPGIRRRVETTPATAIDTTAAGDSFNGAYLGWRLLGRPPEQAAAAGNRLAGAKVRHRGAIMPAGAMPDLTDPGR